MNIVSDFFDVQSKLYTYFRYQEKYAGYPFEDMTRAFWYEDELENTICFSYRRDQLQQYRDGDETVSGIFSYPLYVAKHWTGEDEKHVLYLIDSPIYDSIFYLIFDKEKEIKE